DAPYSELRFNGDTIPSLKSMDEKDLVIFLGTISKIFCPGLRIGWIAAEERLLQKFIIVKQGSDLQSSTRTQMEISKYMELYDIDENIAKIKEIYRNRRGIMLKTMEEEFPETVTFTYPDGGLFTWVQLPEHMNARNILEECLKKQVAFVPGGSFYPNGGTENTFRLNYSNMPEDRIVEGIKRIGYVLKTFDL
ncbi:MAG: PLP-dependent aminotransferase family protein, partial [Clostridiaceae bacterium]|nr:PLP-dependent aminotransferase family protein [Clostridiaceae bacterium]